MKKLVVSIFLLSFLGPVCGDTRSPYVGQELRSIKALSAEDIDGYMNGKGMGMAKAAELNHFPGPLHVLQSRSSLDLDARQVAQTEALYQDMKRKAMVLGRQIIEKERELDQLFADNEVNPANLNNVLNEIGSLRARLRFVHLKAHLRQKAIMTPHQVMRYDQVRGYGSGTGSHQHHSQHQH